MPLPVHPPVHLSCRRGYTCKLVRPLSSSSCHVLRWVGHLRQQLICHLGFHSACFVARLLYPVLFRSGLMCGRWAPPTMDWDDSNIGSPCLPFWSFSPGEIACNGSLTIQGLWCVFLIAPGITVCTRSFLVQGLGFCCFTYSERGLTLLLLLLFVLHHRGFKMSLLLFIFHYQGFTNTLVVVSSSWPVVWKGTSVVCEGSIAKF